MSTKVQKRKPTIKELAQNITPKNRHKETDWGKPQGGEIMNKKAFGIVLIIVVIAVLALLGGGAVYYKSKISSTTDISNSDSTKPTTVPSPIVSQDKTAGWKTYRNDQYGFELKHPADWAELPAQTIQDTLSVGFLILQSNMSFEVKVIPNPDPDGKSLTSVRDILEDFDEQNKAELIAEIKKISGLEFLKLTNKNPMLTYEPKESLIVLSPDKKKTIIFSTVVLKNPPNLELAPKLELIASTLIFK